MTISLPSTCPVRPVGQNRVARIVVRLGLGLLELALSFEELKNGLPSVTGGPSVAYPTPLLVGIGGLRTQLREETGFLLPVVRILDNLCLSYDGYEILIDGEVVASKEIARPSTSKGWDATSEEKEGKARLVIDTLAEVIASHQGKLSD